MIAKHDWNLKRFVLSTTDYNRRRLHAVPTNNEAQMQYIDETYKRWI